MSAFTDINSTARAYYLVRIVNGAIPEEVHGGSLDGLRYFVTDLGDEGTVWVTEVGLFRPPSEGEGTDEQVRPAG